MRAATQPAGCSPETSASSSYPADCSSPSAGSGHYEFSGAPQKVTLWHTSSCHWCKAHRTVKFVSGPKTGEHGFSRTVTIHQEPRALAPDGLHQPAITG